jgi:hypothetical protein
MTKFTDIIDNLNSLKDNINFGDISNAESRLYNINNELLNFKQQQQLDDNNKNIVNEFEDNNESKYVELINITEIDNYIDIQNKNIDDYLTDFTQKIIKNNKIDIELIKNNKIDIELIKNNKIDIELIKNNMPKIKSLKEAINAKIDYNIKSYNEYCNEFNIEQFKDFKLKYNFFLDDKYIDNEMILYSKLFELNDNNENNYNYDNYVKYPINDEITLFTTLIKTSINPYDKNLIDNIESIELLIGDKNLIDDNKIIESQKGGSNNNNNYLEIINYINTFRNLQKEFIEFKNRCRKYNILYVRVFNHILFIVNYMKLIALKQNKDYQIYNYIGLNTIIYYEQIVEKIINVMKNKTTYGRYFSKYYYINIHILFDFLRMLKIKWNEYANINKVVDINRIISKLHLYNNEFIKNPQIKKGVFIFNAMKDLLDKYKSISSPPVAVYLRINKKPDITPSIAPPTEFFMKDKQNTGKLDGTNIKHCISKTNNSEINNSETNNSETNNSETNNSKISSIQFAEIFDSETFNDNAVLSKYMSIPTFLSQGKSIMLLTYGYSGVGKTFTVFGTKDKSGMLQSSLNNIQQKGDIYFRAYELYGMAFPYKSYWQNKDGTPKNSDKYYHFIYDYTKNQNTPTKYNATEMTQFIENIQINPTYPSSKFKKLEPKNLKNFETIITNIDKTRKDHGRIKKTVNNPQSSRSIMIFDFKIKLKNESFVDFVIVDLPGKENIKETFVDKGDTCIGNKKPINNTLNKNLENYIRNMAFLSPLSLMLNNDVGVDFNNFSDVIIENDNFTNDNNFTVTYTGKTYYKKNINTDLNTDYYFGLFRNKTNIFKNYNVRGLEIMRYIIINNRFDLLKQFYNKYLFNKPNDNDCNTHESYSMAPFEGYYINENIIGLLSTILNQLNISKNSNGGPVINEQKELFLGLFKPDKGVNVNITDVNVNFKGVEFINNITDELTAQTYFFRFLITLKAFDNGNGIGNENLNWNSSCYGHPLNEWINDSYDYNKAFNIEKPPISVLLDPYFKNIKNFYVFYVVSNDDPTQCDKQIKLIKDSQVFLNQLNTYNPEIHKSKP